MPSPARARPASAPARGYSSLETANNDIDKFTQIMEADSVIGNSSALPAYHRGSLFDRAPYWQKIARWKDVSEAQFLKYRWSVSSLKR